MGSSPKGPKEPKAAVVAASAKQSSLDIKRAQNEERKRLRGRFGYASTQSAGSSANSATLG